MEQRIESTVKLILSVAFCEMAGVIGSIFTISSIPTWYSGLRKPNIAPPNWLFAPVWTTLYALMGISLFLIWRKTFGKGPGRIAIATFILQLILNVLWSYLFFGLQSALLGLIGITFLWFAIAATLGLFSRISRIAWFLLLPYLIWVSFAAYLNLMIYLLNA